MLRRRAPDLSCYLVGLYDALRYLVRRQICVYRLAAPEGLSAAELERGLGHCGALLGELRRLIVAEGLRLSLHAAHNVVLNSVDGAVVAGSLERLEGYAALLEALCGAEGTIVIHASRAGGRQAGLGRFAAAYAGLDPALRTRLAVEHDDAGYSLGELLALHQACGVRVVLDYLHLQLHNPERLRLADALGLALATWPPGERAEVHLSSARTEAHVLPARRGLGAAIVPPRPGQHADFIARADALALLAATPGLPAFDVLLEAKAGDLALLRLREELAGYGLALE